MAYASIIDRDINFNAYRGINFSADYDINLVKDHGVNQKYDLLRHTP